MAGVRAPVSRILFQCYGVMMGRGVMKVHIHEGCRLKRSNRNALGCGSGDPAVAVHIIILAAVAVEIDTVAGVINVVVGGHSGNNRNGRWDDDRYGLRLGVARELSEGGHEQGTENHRQPVGLAKVCFSLHENKMRGNVKRRNGV